ncbi:MULTISPECIES: TetR/AcrR family transcriptional regulator [Providencia]|uniref:TetR/AcrR family transcriptional regulator n=1 Tax=Providencia huashanensis TaxID=3037798 RepID=A0AA42JTX7_9GAMM|nr:MULTISPECIES: TetR/AcrR family transcriptional regulator [Providencia]NIL72904.1 TetR/AcrR family transcriptional regulator [Providencia sp. 504mA]HCI95640.1 TetR/AcrR family transcriptional regulator [Providencia sp.]APC11085.1 Bacterial regulatory protein, tetR family [Providencia rettgeri]AVL74648.1 TetR/AcrR family transcriptional regulator [Providencia rettgeri]EIL1984454.1 TetR/AcrR family transcriptional regulator [Providencia rettgeri]
MKDKKPGRPPANQQTISLELIVTKAIEMLDDNKVDNLSMRMLAKKINVNPMALYHYFSDKDALIQAIANRLYQDIQLPDLPDLYQQIESLLLHYRQKVTLYPQITLAIFSSPNAFPEQAKRITEILTQQLMKLGLSQIEATKWGHILIDYTHGEALSVSPKNQAPSFTPEAIHTAELSYSETIKMLLFKINSK